MNIQNKDKVTVSLAADKSQDAHANTEIRNTEGLVGSQDKSPAASPANPKAPANSPASQLQYTPITTIESATLHSENIVAVSRDEYVGQFKRAVEKTARATLDMCRVVYEASRVLKEADFDAFCKAIGYRDSSSTIRKFIAIGKLQPRMIQYADQLPHSWSSIYMLTQIPAKEFEYMLEKGVSLSSLKGSALTELVKSTKDVSSIDRYLPKNQEVKKLILGHLCFTKSPIDDTDWRAMAKAINELEARLPIKFVINKEAEYVWEKRKNQRYEMTKKCYENVELKPELWDLGRDANAVDEEAIKVANIKAAIIKAKKTDASVKTKELSQAA